MLRRFFVRSVAGIVEPKRLDECEHRSRLLSSTRVVQEEPWERLPPRLEDANEYAGITRAVALEWVERSDFDE
jgi:hypothetical protein